MKLGDREGLIAFNIGRFEAIILRGGLVGRQQFV